jgi:hypothetical protein
VVRIVFLIVVLLFGLLQEAIFIILLQIHHIHPALWRILVLNAKIQPIHIAKMNGFKLILEKTKLLYLPVVDQRNVLQLV